MTTLNEIYLATQNLTVDDLKKLSTKILSMLGSDASGEETTMSEMHRDHCCKCDSKQIVKYGKDRNGKQRYICKSCKTVFLADSYTVVSKTRHSMDTWKHFIELMLSRASLQKCADECNICVSTAFSWRHKILNALQKDQCNRVLCGIVEADETYLGLNYKGNHTKSKTFVMPRKSYKRGTDSREQIGTSACIMCAVERNGQFYGEVLGKGQPTIAKLSHAFEERILPESIFISDRSVSINRYFTNYNHNVQLIQLNAHLDPKKMKSPPEVKGAFHIQNVNNLHYRFKKHLEPYCGVATKYLNHYLNLFIWIENHKNLNYNDFKKEICDYMFIPDTYIPTNKITSMPPIPVVA